MIVKTDRNEGEEDVPRKRSVEEKMDRMDVRRHSAEDVSFNENDKTAIASVGKDGQHDALTCSKYST